MKHNKKLVYAGIKSRRFYKRKFNKKVRHSEIIANGGFFKECEEHKEYFRQYARNTYRKKCGLSPLKNKI